MVVEVSAVTRCDAEARLPGLVVDLVAKAGRVDNGQGDAGAFLVQLQF